MSGLLLAGGCAPKTETTRIDGSSTVYPISEKVAEEYLQDHPNAKVIVAFNGTSGGMAAFSKGEIEICDASRPMKDSEKAECEKNGVQYTEFTIAYDGIAVVVNKDNDWCDTLTVEQLKELWREGSEVKTWKDLNPEWPETEFDLYGPDENSGTFEYFVEAIIGKDQPCRTDYNPSANDNQLVRGVQQDAGGLGYFGFAYYAENKDTLKLLTVDGGEGPKAPSVETIRDGSYAPLSRPLFIYVNNATVQREEVRGFLQLYIDRVGEVVEEVGYVPVPEATLAENKAKLATLLGK